MTKPKSTSPKNAAIGASSSPAVTPKLTNTVEPTGSAAAGEIAPTMLLEPDPTLKRTTKLSAVLSLLQRTEGALTSELIAATNWQAHTIRATLSGLRKQGHVILATKGEGGTSYRLQAPKLEA